MRSTFTLTLISLVFFNMLWAQAPQAIKYQATARDANGVAIVSTTISLRTSIVDMNSNTVLYSETHAPQTSQFGQFTIEIGRGTPVSGTFAAIDWSPGERSLRVETDFSGGTNYMVLAESELLSVPYALYAEKAGSYTDTIIVMDTTFAVIYDTVKVLCEDTLVSSIFRDPCYPMGLDGDMVYLQVDNTNTYTVPAGKVLQLIDNRTPDNLYVDNKRVYGSNFLLQTSAVLRYQSATPAQPSYTRTAVLLDEVPEISPVLICFQAVSSTSYTVPTGKRLMVNGDMNSRKVYDGCLTVDGNNFIPSENPQCLQHVFEEGTVLGVTSSLCVTATSNIPNSEPYTIVGYLVDK